MYDEINILGGGVLVKKLIAQCHYASYGNHFYIKRKNLHLLFNAGE